MTALQQRRGLFGLAFAAVAMALLLTLAAPQKAVSARSSAYIAVSSGTGAPSLSARWTQWEWPVSTHGTGADYMAWSAILPVFFIGLLSPLVLLFVSATWAERPSVAPSVTSLFQRPPPAQTL